MSQKILTLLDLFSGKRTIQQETESHIAYDGTYNCAVADLKLPKVEELKQVFERFPARDNVSLSIAIAGVEPTTIGSKDQGAFPVRLDELQSQEQAAQPTDQCFFTLKVIKTVADGKMTLHSTHLFLTHLQGRNLAERLAIFNGFIKETPAITLVCDEPLSPFGSSTIEFVSDETANRSVEVPSREEILTSRDDVAHFADGVKYRLVPQDFHLVNAPTHKGWQTLFQQLENVLVVAFTADYTAFNSPTELTFKISGYKTLVGTLKAENLAGANWDAAFKIYRWAYQEGSMSDKVGLLRNMLSLNLDSNGHPLYTDDVYQSVKSGFAIYLKRNVAQYIEVKNKMAEFLHTLSNQATEDADKCTDALRVALGVLITFFISTIMLKAISGRGLTGIFTTDITYLTYAILMVSSIYLGLSLLMLRRDVKRIKDQHESLKAQYSDILDADDLNRIFPERTLNDILGEVKRQVIWIILAWGMVAVILGAVAFILHRKQASSPPAIQPEASPQTSPQPRPTVASQSSPRITSQSSMARSQICRR